MSLQMGWAVDFLDSPADGLEFRYWSGMGQLTIGTGTDAVTYEGTNGVIAVNPPTEKSGEAVRMTIVMDATDAAVRQQLRHDMGPLRVRVRWLYREGDGAWVATGKQFVGRLSSPVLNGAQFEVDIESMISDIDRRRLVNWSNDSQQQRHPGDKGMEYLASYAEGIKTKWPP